MALGTHYLPSGRLKNEFGEGDKAMFRSIERPCEIIFYNQGINKIELDEVA
jgi:hypothetical protein